MKELTVDEYMNLPSAAPDHSVAYGDEAEQFGHLYVPKTTGPHPVIILIHGGCWRAQYGLEPLGSLCVALREMGVAVWSVEYRRLGNGDNERGGWPTTFLDVARAADYLRTLAAEHGLDLNRTLIMGHSAGGHLALWLAARRHLPTTSELYRADPLPVRGVIALAGIPDLAGAVAQGICGDAPRALLGGSPEEVSERYAHGSPRELLPLNVPQRLINGVHDAIVPVDSVQEYQRIARTLGDDVRLALHEGGHFDAVMPDTAAWPVITQAVRELLAL